MRGIITEINGNFAILLNDKGEFMQIRNKAYDIGQKLIIKKRNMTAFVSLAASLIIFFISAFSGYSIYYTPTNYVSIDINPSVQLTINRFNRIIETQSFNNDGKIVLEKEQIKNLPLETGVEKIIDSSRELGYLHEGNDEVLIDVVNDDVTTVQKIKNKIQKYEDAPIVIDIEQSDDSILQLSKDLDISVGRTKAIYEYTNSVGGDIYANKETLSSISTTKIKKEVKNKEKASENNKQNKVNESTSDNSEDDSSKSAKSVKHDSTPRPQSSKQDAAPNTESSKQNKSAQVHSNNKSTNNSEETKKETTVEPENTEKESKVKNTNGKADSNENKEKKSEKKDKKRS